MLVKSRMSSSPITISPDTSLHDALSIMRENKVRRLPVLDSGGRLVGLVLERDLLYAAPSPATSLNVYEMNYLISKIKVKDLMASDLITVTEDTPIEEAARVMVDNNIGGLPVVRDGKLVGMITESDLFEIFLEILGGREAGLRVTIGVKDARGVLAQLTRSLAEYGADIVSLGTFWGDDPGEREITFRVQNLDPSAMEKIVRDMDAELVDIRECTPVCPT
jgi:acetoin utilization protein AcuB